MRPFRFYRTPNSVNYMTNKGNNKIVKNTLILEIFEMMHGNGHVKKNKSNELPKFQATKRGISVPL